MYNVQADTINNILNINIYQQSNQEIIQKMLSKIENERKHFSSSYKSLVILHEDISIMNNTNKDIDFTIFSGKLGNLRKAIIVYKKYSKVSKNTAEDLKNFYYNCGVNALTTNCLIEAKKALNIFWK